jgi:hypothetical protein
MTDFDIGERVALVVNACGDNEALLDYLWQVMEGGDEGVSREEVVSGAFAGDVLLFERVNALIEEAWRQPGVESASTLISEKEDGRLIMFTPARDIVFGLLDTD